MEKKDLRKQILQRRGQLPEEVRREKSAQIVSRILKLPLFLDSSCIFLFIPFGHEADISEVLNEGLRLGKKLVVPKTFTKQKKIVPYPFLGWDGLVSGVFGILEPDIEKLAQADPKEIDLILMPGVAFDRQGGRLGYGGGFYDRFLAGLKSVPPLVAVAFSEQLVERVPTEPHDLRVNYIITDEENILCPR